jgi:hypothetical protein
LPTPVNKKYCHLEQQDACQLCGVQAEDVYQALILSPRCCAPRSAMRDHWSLPCLVKA